MRFLKRVIDDALTLLLCRAAGNDADLVVVRREADYVFYPKHHDAACQLLAHFGAMKKYRRFYSGFLIPADSFAEAYRIMRDAFRFRICLPYHCDEEDKEPRRLHTPL